LRKIETTFDPIKPVPPMTTIFMDDLLLSKTGDILFECELFACK
jgi:hypothetical protein